MGGGKVVVLGDERQWEGIVGSGKTVVVDFTATWCGPCRAISPVFAKLSELEQNADLVFLEVDVDNCARVAALAGVSAMPTFQVWKDGKQVGESVLGANPPKLEALLASAREHTPQTVLA